MPPAVSNLNFRRTGKQPAKDRYCGLLPMVTLGKGLNRGKGRWIRQT